MSLQVFQKVLVGHHGFFLSLNEGSQILLILAKGQAHSVIDEIGHGALGMGRLYAESSMQVRTEVDCGTLCRLTHGHHLHEQE
jgi:hypothetical protein